MIYITKTIDGQTWNLQHSDGLKVEVGSVETSTRDGKTLKFKVQGGTPPHKPSSTGRVWGNWLSHDESGDEVLDQSASEYYPQVFDLTWVDKTPVSTEPQKNDEPSGELIGVILTAMIKDGIKQGIDAAMAAQRDEVKTLVAATLADLVAEMEKTAFDVDDHHDEIRDCVLDDFEIDDHLDLSNYRDEISEIAKEDLADDIKDHVKTALNDLIEGGKLALTLSDY
tara:strand:- start:247 stop:921 length:675 start_codon:yes stop_codon:yes gene_type:complete